MTATDPRENSPVPVALVVVVSGNNTNHINRELEKTMREMLQEDYWLIRATTQVSLSPVGGHPRFTTQLEFAEQSWRPQ